MARLSIRAVDDEYSPPDPSVGLDGVGEEVVVLVVVELEVELDMDVDFVVHALSSTYLSTVAEPRAALLTRTSMPRPAAHCDTTRDRAATDVTSAWSRRANVVLGLC